ncbi:uncharacterized protein LOC123675337 [Harmonia axyridis]|uniref:uncharacterized protein LOC123675337 n=1 Tax=Harmonia axyridis TaxID=115357 RepID=UPI001E2787DB|nr:uncharacterized protein LOC123675337 [Harmonia axyridis]
MGELPSARVTPSRPFSHCGVDYAGPIIIKERTLRRTKFVKAYICIFVCFSTRAIHIELVKDLSTESFNNALNRFIARRGKPSKIYSDNGSNFKGARNYFLELHDLLTNKVHNKKLFNFLTPHSIEWSFIPAKSPHMGGIWEAAVKSTKYHLKRILGIASITYEEMYTILTLIESCLNSRPLSPLSSDPDDYLHLTPAHFLIGDSLAAPPQKDVRDINLNKLSRYQCTQQLTQHFWSRWSKEYLTQLQQRHKWRTPDATPKIGDLVVLKEDNIPPLRRLMGRIVDIHPGADKVPHVMSVGLSNGSVFKRSTNKVGGLCTVKPGCIEFIPWSNMTIRCGATVLNMAAWQTPSPCLNNYTPSRRD